MAIFSPGDYTEWIATQPQVNDDCNCGFQIRCNAAKCPMCPPVGDSISLETDRTVVINVPQEEIKLREINRPRTPVDTIRSGVPNQDANNANYEQQLKWSKAKRDAVMLRTHNGIEKPEQQENWGAHDELTVLAKMCKVQFILFETAQTTESQKITIGDDGLPPIAILNTDNLHFDFLKPRVTSVSCADITGDSDSEWGNNYE